MLKNKQGENGNSKDLNQATVRREKSCSDAAVDPYSNMLPASLH